MECSERLIEDIGSGRKYKHVPRESVDDHTIFSLLTAQAKP
jgi:hypothetical protein